MAPPPRRRVLGALGGFLAAVALLAGLPGAGAGAATPGTASVPAPGGWTWPLPPPHVVIAPFAPPAAPWLPGQRGVVLAGRPGERVFAAGAGRIGFAGQVGGTPVVTVIHGALRTTYEPVAPALPAGRPVRAGEVIGRLQVGGSECAPRACLHWGLLRGRDYLDPLSLLGLELVRLLPADSPPA